MAPLPRGEARPFFCHCLPQTPGTQTRCEMQNSLHTETHPGVTYGADLSMLHVYIKGRNHLCSTRHSVTNKKQHSRFSNSAHSSKKHTPPLLQRWKFLLYNVDCVEMQPNLQPCARHSRTLGVSILDRRASADGVGPCEVEWEADASVWQCGWCGHAWDGNGRSVM